MPDGQIAPNELADLYDALFTLLEELPDGGHPGWAFAIESVIFGGEGLASDSSCYGEQQAERNEFRMSDYREQYGDGSHVTDFPTIETETVEPADVPELAREVAVPIAPVSESRLPIIVEDDDLAQAVALLNELPAEPEADHPGEGHHQLLNPRRFPSLGVDVGQAAGEREDSTDDGDSVSELEPNELAEAYDGLRQLLRQLPDGVHPIWEEAVETMVFGGEFILPGRTPYGEQQANRNEFSMDEYRDAFGDGDRVTSFSFFDTTNVIDGSESRLSLLAPAPGVELPVDPPRSELAAALALLAELPAQPGAADGDRSDDNLLFFEGLLQKADIDPSGFESATNQAETTSDPPADGAEPAERAPTDTSESEGTTESDSTTESDHSPTTILEQEAGESSVPLSETGATTAESDPKYDDPRAQRAHEEAQRRHPAEIVEKGEEIDIVLQEVDYTYTEPTIMGKKNDLVVFIEEAPQDLSRFDVVRARVVGYGRSNTCAKAVFTGYTD